MELHEITIKKEGFILKKTGDALVIFSCPDCKQKMMITKLHAIDTMCHCGYAWRMDFSVIGTKPITKKVAHIKGGEL